jgi:uncharacterized membrane protein YgcG
VLSQVTDDVFVAVGFDLANTILVRTSEGHVVIDVAMNPERCVCVSVYVYMYVCMYLCTYVRACVCRAAAFAAAPSGVVVVLSEVRFRGGGGGGGGGGGDEQGTADTGGIGGDGRQGPDPQHHLHAQPRGECCRRV